MDIESTTNDKEDLLAKLSKEDLEALEQAKNDLLVDTGDEDENYVTGGAPPQKMVSWGRKEEEDFDKDGNDLTGATGSTGANEEEQAMSEDIYALMSTTRITSMSYLFGMLVFMTQMCITVLVFVDLVDVSDNPYSTNGVVNRMYIPADVSKTVTVAQFLGWGLTVSFAAAQGDMLAGFTHLLKGYDPEIKKQNENVTRFKWYMAGIMQFSCGAMLLIDLAVLMMQSTSNIVLCLNFAALHFVQDIDDVAFSVGEMGFINRPVQKDCQKISSITVKAKTTRRLNVYTRLLLVVLVIVLYTFFFIVAGWQWTGRFMCKSVFVQFGDDFGESWPYYSGKFSTPSTRYWDRTEGRFEYIDSTNTIRLAYCNGEAAWTFSYVESNDECDYFIKSTETITFDILDVAGATWFAKTDSLGDVPMDWLKVVCNDCNEDTCNPDRGTCEENTCVCNRGWFGINCEFVDGDEDVCPVMALDKRSKGDISGLAFGSVFMNKEFRRVSFDVGGNLINNMYNRPFYVSFSKISADSKIETFMVFSGYRWIVYGVPQSVRPSVTLEEFQNYMVAMDPGRQPLQALRNLSTNAFPDFLPLFFSAPVQFETRTHRADPITTKWVLARQDDRLSIVKGYADVASPVPASFLCAACHNETNPCLNDGVCGSGICGHYGAGRTPIPCQPTQCNCNATGFKSYDGQLCEYALGCLEVDDAAEMLNGCVCDKVFGICTRCDNGYYGNLCQFVRDTPEFMMVESGGDVFGGHRTCENSTCLNGGYCPNNLAACQCPMGWEGPVCEIMVSNTTEIENFVCTNTTCLNGGVCQNVTEPCLCPFQYTGFICEIFLGNSSAFGGGGSNVDAESLANTTISQFDPEGVNAGALMHLFGRNVTEVEGNATNATALPSSDDDFSPAGTFDNDFMFVGNETEIIVGDEVEEEEEGPESNNLPGEVTNGADGPTTTTAGDEAMINNILNGLNGF